MAAEIARILNGLARLVNPRIQHVKQPNMREKISLRAMNQWLFGNSRIQTLASQREVSRLADVTVRRRISGYRLMIEDMFPIRFPTQRHPGAPCHLFQFGLAR
jgi:hypothetical protein